MKFRNLRNTKVQVSRLSAAILMAVLWSQSAALPVNKPDTVKIAPALWKEPNDISSRDLFRGPDRSGGAPQGPFVFVKEDLEGTNPKFSVRDGNGIEWKVKVGVEARPEVAAGRLLWSVGFFTADYYFLPELRVQKLPLLKRGREFLGPDGVFYGARLKREPDHVKKIDNWRWKENPFVGSREFNGLRVMMALINNWDLKTVNNAILGQRGSRSGPVKEEIYMISDLGSSFGTSNWIRPLDHAKGNIVSYSESKFIRKITDEYVDFNIGLRPAIINAVNPPLYFKYLKMGWIGKRIPRADARWIGAWLSRLSEKQIKDAFRAAGYSPYEIDGFTRILLTRIKELKDL